MKFKFTHLLFIILISCLFFFKTNCDCIEPFDLLDIPMYLDRGDDYNRRPSSFRETISSKLFNIRSTKQVFKNPHNAYPEYLRTLEEGFNKRTDDYGYYVSRGSSGMTPSRLTGEVEYLTGVINLFCVNQNSNIIEYRSAISLDDLDTYFIETIPKKREIYTNRQIPVVNIDGVVSGRRLSSTPRVEWTIENTSLIRLYSTNPYIRSEGHVFSMGKDHNDSNMIIIFTYDIGAQGKVNVRNVSRFGPPNSLDDSGVWAITQQIHYSNQ